MLFAWLGAACLISCTKEQPENLPDVQLGKQLENPYSVENMKKAWRNLQENDNAYRMMNDSISTTHLYLKFKPANEDELSLLQQDSTLVLYTYPLDYEIPEELEAYHDPEIVDSLPTYQYCAVPLDKQLPAVAYDILEELFIPDEDSDDNENQRRFISEEITNNLVDEALRITGNLEAEDDIDNQRQGRKWRPAGNVKVYTTFSSYAINSRYIPVHGVKVRARRWFTTHTGIANASGNYSCNGRFRRKANYSIKWERYHFSIRSGTVGQAMKNGPKKKGNWNPKFGNTGNTLVKDKQQYYALIFQAAHYYYYGDRMGLTSPSRNSAWKKQLKIAARAKSGSSSHVHQRTLYWGADISLQAYERKADMVFATTIHELAHGAHRELHKDNYNHLVEVGYVLACLMSGVEECSSSVAQDIPPVSKNRRRLLETWAQTVEIVFTRDWYINKCNISNYKYASKNGQSVWIEDQPYYTSAGYDLIDDEDQFETENYLCPKDRVKGYSILQLEAALKHAKSWEDWRDNIKNNYHNNTEQYVDELFANWSDF